MDHNFLQTLQKKICNANVDEETVMAELTTLVLIMLHNFGNKKKVGNRWVGERRLSSWAECTCAVEGYE